MNAKDLLGRQGEQLAADFLSKAGLVILDRNWRCSQGEIDIVATDGGTRAFVAECKWGHVDIRDLRKLQERTQLMLRELEGVTSVKYALFSRHTPVDRALLEEISGGRVMWLGLDSLLRGSKG